MPCSASYIGYSEFQFYHSKMGNYSWSICLAPCLLITKVLKVPGHQQLDLICGVVTPYGVMNLVNDGPGNGLFSDGAKPSLDQCWLLIKMFHDDSSRYNYDIHRWWRYIWMYNFQMSPGLNGLNEIRGLSGNFYWHLQKAILLNL